MVEPGSGRYQEEKKGLRIEKERLWKQSRGWELIIY
jgi:hypothetical protein